MNMIAKLMVMFINFLLQHIYVGGAYITFVIIKKFTQSNNFMVLS